MFLYKHPNGIWYIHYDDPSGRKLKRSTRCKNKNDALKFLQSWEHTEKEEQQTLQNLHLSEFRDRYLEHARLKFVSKSVNGICTVLRDLIKELNDPLIRRIRSLDVSRFIDARQAAHGMWSARHYYGMLASAFQTAVQWDILTENPFRKVKKPEPPRQLPLFFSKEEFQTYLSVIDRPIFKDLSVIAVLTCLRLNELLFLEWDDVDLSKRLIHVRNKDTFITKTKRNRTIPMHDEVADILIRLHENRTGPFIFSHKGKRLQDMNASATVKSYIRKSGVNPKLHFHSFRHTGATWMVQAGISIYTVSKILGHSSVSTTQIYAHWSPDQFHSAVNSIRLEGR